MEAQPASKAPKQIGIDTIILLADKGHSQSEIAKIVGCSPQNIQARLDHYDYNGLKTFRESKDQVFERLQADLAKSINPEDIKNMAVRDRFMGIGILEDKIRLIRGQATEISVNFDAVKAIDARRKEIEARIRAIESGAEVIEVETHVALPKEHGDNGAPDNIMNNNSTLQIEQCADKNDYVNYGKEGPRQGTRRGRPRKGR